MIDPTPWVGVPFVAGGRDRNGCDCWGLLRLAWLEGRGIALPSYTLEYDPLEGAEIERLLRGESGAWRRVETPEPWDLVLLRKAGFACHVGLVLGSDRFLHVDSGQLSRVERWSSPRWKRRLEGFYRREVPA